MVATNLLLRTFEKGSSNGHFSSFVDQRSFMLFIHIHKIQESPASQHGDLSDQQVFISTLRFILIYRAKE